MKTIRTNCFETNSSSTHSITITSKSKALRAESPLVENAVLIPVNLKETSAFRESGCDGDGYTLHAFTTDEKAALLICHIESLSCTGRTSNQVCRRLLKETVDALIRLVGYADVKTSGLNYSIFSAYSEDSTYIDDLLGYNHYVDDNEIDDNEAYENFVARVEDHIRNVVLNDDIMIIDCENPY